MEEMDLSNNVDKKDDDADKTDPIPTISHDLKELDIKRVDTRYFVCNFCKQWNIINPDNIKDFRGNADKQGRTKYRKKTVHMELDPDLALIFKKFCLNFGDYEGGIVALLNSFQIKHELEKK